MVQGVLDFVEKEYAEDFKKLKKVVTPAEFIHIIILIQQFILL